MPKKFILSNETSLDGLHRRPKYDELIGEINKPLITQYPDRKATQLRNSNWLQQLDGDDFTAIQQMNHNIMKEHEKDILLKHYAAAYGVPLGEVKSMHSKPAETAPPTTEYFDMAADDEPMPDAPTEAPTADNPLFGPEIDLTHENLYKTADRQPMRSKTINKIQKEKGKQNTRRKEKLAKEEHDEAIAQVAAQDMKDVEMENARAADKKRAFSELITHTLAQTKTDVDDKTKGKKKGNKIDEDEENTKLSKVHVKPYELLETEKALDEHKNKQKRNSQVGGSSSSKDAPKKEPKKSSKRKRSKSPDPETLREKNTLSKGEILAIQNHDVAIQEGHNLVHHVSENAWKMALGKNKKPYQDQMALRGLKFNQSYTISRMIQAILNYDKK